MSAITPAQMQDTLIRFERWAMVRWEPVLVFDIKDITPTAIRIHCRVADTYYWVPRYTSDGRLNATVIRR